LAAVEHTGITILSTAAVDLTIYVIFIQQEAVVKTQQYISNMYIT
jgi:hypothetical protein